MSSSWSILYEADGQIWRLGPFDKESEALEYAKKHDVNNVKDGGMVEFDITEQRIYIIGPDHSMYELSMSDLGVSG